MIYRLSFRDPGREVGGGVRGGQLELWESGVPGPAGRTAIDRLRVEERVTFLLHGFNVSLPDGTGSLTRLAADLQAAVGGGLVATLWPGDSPLGGITYPFEGSAADDTAAELARFIDDHLATAGVPLSFASHSLGGRVVLETQRRLAAAGLATACACLMAPAVDDFSLADPDEYRSGVERAERVAVLHSTGDSVLKWLYPAGDWLQAFVFFWRDEAGFALGYHGPRRHRDDAVPANVIASAIGAYDVDHGDYLPPADPGTAWDARQRSAAAYAAQVLTGTEQPEYPHP